jgi:hypothetical protein
MNSTGVTRPQYAPECYPTKSPPYEILGGIFAGLSDFTHASVKHYSFLDLILPFLLRYE